MSVPALNEKFARSLPISSGEKVPTLTLIELSTVVCFTAHNEVLRRKLCKTVSFSSGQAVLHGGGGGGEPHEHGGDRRRAARRRARPRARLARLDRGGAE